MTANFNQKSLQTYVQGWLTFNAPSTVQSSERIKEHVRALYARLGLEKPQVILCRGPLQQVIFPALVSLMLKNGKGHSAKPRFVRPAVETLQVFEEWQRLWREAFDEIDWEHSGASDEGTGQLIIPMLERATNRTLKSQLTLAIDEELGTFGEKLENLLDEHLERPMRQRRAALIPGGAELGNIWSNFLAHVTPEYLALLDVVEAASDWSFPITASGPINRAWLGAAEWHWMAAHDFASIHMDCKLSERVQHDLSLWIELANLSNAYMFCENCCFVSMKPVEISFDNNWRLHGLKKAAVRFADGTEYFMWHGVEMDEQAIMRPEKLTVRMIEKERNTEVRRALIEIYGLDNFIRGCAAKKIQEDEYGTLYRKEYPGDEPIVVVKVYNSTPEPDGSCKVYFLRVPPNMRTAREAVAWTFGMRARDYKPTGES